MENAPPPQFRLITEHDLKMAALARVTTTRAAKARPRRRWFAPQTSDQAQPPVPTLTVLDEFRARKSRAEAMRWHPSHVS